MTGTKIIEEKPINLVQLRQHLNTIKKRDEELNFRAGKTEEYLNSFVEISAKDAEKLTKAIEEMSISRLKPEHINKIIDILPESAEEVKSTLLGYSLTVKPEDLKKIADAVLEVLPEKKKEQPAAE